MNSFNKITSCMLACVSIALAGCGSYSSPTSPVTSDTVTSSIDGNWVVASLMERDEDKSGTLGSYVLTFATTSTDAGTVTATRDNSTVSGTWRHSPAVTYYGSSSTESIVLNLGATTPLNQLSGTWNVVSSSNTSLSLASPEIAQQERLVLNKR